ncbi:putative Zn-dependent protease [Catalinimonas alkaloidigena]|uniref:M48 family metalloprotease n=1 Tax=Catalinimonas alkaloidigena TaxID=1075417 RepID=UPI002405899B|nr:M48 family metalloprotease [Catalinimonas alkaloidigena]MDF9798439.1 putative Zn-dependent protease [Catalinimonas alkaloidigena]
MNNKFSFRFFFYAISCSLFIAFSSCEEDSALFISPEQQIELGRQLDSTIMASPGEYPVLDASEYPEAYDYLEGIFDEILRSNAVRYEEFPWQIRIIEGDETLNAFAAPGGFAYVYTGLIKYLDSEDDLAGVLGHEIAHADLEHSARQMERQYGASLLLSIVLGDGTAQQLGQIATGLVGLKFSRNFERNADEKSVEYLSDTRYNCAAARSFFQKLEEEGQAGGTPEFLSTHPDPGSRVENITEKANAVGCDTDPLDPASYDDFKAMLP